jgi:hypothetical protein
MKAIKSRRMRWVGHAARKEEEKCIQNFSRKIWREEISLFDLGEDGWKK